MSQTSPENRKPKTESRDPKRGCQISAFVVTVAGILVTAFSVSAQVRPYIGFVYPAGGQQGTTFQIRVGGQGLDDIKEVLVSGSGVTAKRSEYYRRLGNQEMQLLNEQLSVLRRETMSESARTMLKESEKMMAETSTNGPAPGATASVKAGEKEGDASAELKTEAARKLIDRIERRTLEYVQTPASASIASLVLVEVTIAPEAEPGEREIRLVTLRGVTNPLKFRVGQLPEVAKKPMVTAIKQVLGKEGDALRKRPAGENEEFITVPCTVNGQVGSGEVSRYHFSALRGQRLVITTLGRELVPFIADAVPGWFQPVLTLYDGEGKEVAYADDYRFNPDPTIFYAVPKDGEYVFSIGDSLYRGREDFVYRVSIGELPFITSVFPLGRQVGASGEGGKPESSGAAALRPQPTLKGWNLEGAELGAPVADGPEGTCVLAANRKGLVSNRVRFEQDTLPEVVEQEPNNSIAEAQKVSLPVIINGHIDKPGDWDVFEFNGRSNDVVVAEVLARRIDSPLDSVLKLTDSGGKLLAFNDDHEDLGVGINTHAADSYVMTRLPADGRYYVHIGDTAGQGGEDYGYRLRISAPRPNFELCVVPSSLNLRAKSSGVLTVYAIRKDGFQGGIQLSLKDPPPGFSAAPVTMAPAQSVARISIKTSLTATTNAISLSVVGSGTVGEREVIHEAVAAEDEMQAFLWRRLVPARDLLVLVFDPNYRPAPKRIVSAEAMALAATNALIAANLAVTTNAIGGTNTAGAATNTVPNKPKFSKQQVAGRLRQLGQLFEEGMLTDEFYAEKVVECEAGE